MEEEILLRLHALQQPWLDEVFLISHKLGAGWFCPALVVVAVLWCLLAGRRREAALWAGLGGTTWLLQWGLKLLIGRARPELWPQLLHLTSYAFPSGHALAAATFYPLIAWAAGRRWPRYRSAAWAGAAAMALYIGLGRLYLGVHWPSDVLAGWALGALQTWLGIRLVTAAERRAAG